jgi:hypothetical protein
MPACPLGKFPRAAASRETTRTADPTTATDSDAESPLRVRQPGDGLQTILTAHLAPTLAVDDQPERPDLRRDGRMRRQMVQHDTSC